MIQDNPGIRAINRVIGQYREAQLDVDGLQENIAAIMTALEGDVPQDIRDVIRHAESEIEFIRFMVNSSEQRSAVEKILRGIDDTLSKYE